MKKKLSSISENSSSISETLIFDDLNIIKPLCGEHDKNLKIISRQLKVKLQGRGNKITIQGKSMALEKAKHLLQELYFIIESGYMPGSIDVVHAIKMVYHDSSASIKDVFLDTIIRSSKGRPITPKSIVQKNYVDAIRKHDMVMGIGPAGTGKTYLAMAMAISSFTRKEVRRIILTRPAVEAGEKLGFLPGDLFEKVNPYLRPLYDALHDIMDINKATDLLHKGTIEVAPLAFMRGRTLNDSFIILDEAQNTTPEQMKMFLTRIGLGSKAVITGDITQIDLPQATASGLVDAHRVLSKIRQIQFTFFSEKDVVRHPIVEKIIMAYENVSHRGVGNEK